MLARKPTLGLNRISFASQLDWENAMPTGAVDQASLAADFSCETNFRERCMRQGKLLHIHIAPAAFYEMEDLAEA
ncbi:hypothetical protein NKH56_26590 [Mesorhizobium sp. M1076]